MPVGDDSGLAHMRPVVSLLVWLALCIGAQGVVPTWAVGFNEPWAAQYALSDPAVRCGECPTNMQPRSLPEAACRLRDMAGTRHVGSYREIIPFDLVQPAAAFDDPVNAHVRELLRDVLALYAGFNLTLTLAFDRPAPAWASPSGWCVIPPLSNVTAWGGLKSDIAWLIGRFVAWLAAPAGGGLSPDWIQTHLLLEPWNEFDAVADSDCGFPSTAPSPARAADLAGGVNYVLVALGMGPGAAPTLVSPSVTGSYPGAPWGPYLAAFYAAGGVGLPSMHYYTCELGALEAGVAAVTSVLPPALRQQRRAARARAHGIPCGRRVQPGAPRCEQGDPVLAHARAR